MQQGGRRRRRPARESPDDTSLLGLAAVWAELDAPMPPKRQPSHRLGRRGERRIPTFPTALLAGLAMAVALALTMIILLLTALR
ncbi:MAG: hypothetical protein ACRDWI_13040 [Jiangellaceae bacterium]